MKGPDEQRSRKGWATTLVLLGADQVPTSKHALACFNHRTSVGASPVALLWRRRPTSAALCAAVHFCLLRADPKRERSKLRACYPPQAPAHNREARQQLGAWLQELDAAGKLRLPRPATQPALVSLLASPTPAKASALLAAVSRYALAVVAQREYGIVESTVPTATGGAGVKQEARVVALAQMFVAERQAFQNAARQTNQALAALAREHEALTRERSKLLAMEQQEEQEQEGENKEDEGLSAIGIVGTMEPLWAKLEELQESSAGLLAACRQEDQTTPRASMDSASLAEVCASAGASPGAFSSRGLAAECEQVVGMALPALTDTFAERLRQAAAHWAARAEKLDAAAQQAEQVHTEQEHEHSALVAGVAQLERELSDHKHDESALAAAIFDDSTTSRLVARCLSAMESAQKAQ